MERTERLIRTPDKNMVICGVYLSPQKETMLKIRNGKKEDSISVDDFLQKVYAITM